VTSSSTITGSSPRRERRNNDINALARWIRAQYGHTTGRRVEAASSSDRQRCSPGAQGERPIGVAAIISSRLTSPPLFARRYGHRHEMWDGEQPDPAIVPALSKTDVIAQQWAISSGGGCRAVGGVVLRLSSIVGFGGAVETR
jgi:hypothetical protein